MPVSLLSYRQRDGRPEKTPSYLKGLAETRARASAEVLRYERILQEVGEALVKSRAELVACDTLIKKFDERLNPELIELLQLEFRLDFVDWREKRNWLHRSVGNQLNVLIERGLVERLHNQTVNSGQTGSWRWKGEGGESLDDLAALAESSGVTTNSRAAPYEPEDEPATEGLPV